jgi:acetyltransferase-like isoleucine patch superfamily enzyme
MKYFFVFCLNFVTSLVRYKNKLGVKIGAHSSAYLWRIKSHTEAKFCVGADSLCMSTIAFERAGAVVDIGDRTFVGGSGLFSVCDRINIGNDVMISWGCTICDHDSHSLRYSERKNDVVNFKNGVKNWDNVKTAPVVIHDKVWIGFNCSILKGVTVGEGAVVAAGSNVVKSVPPWALVGGNPARVIRMLDPE